MTDTRKRIPAGVPTGGEFAANEHDEAVSGLGGVQASSLYPSEAEEWLEHIADRRGDGFERYSQMDAVDQEQFVSDLRLRAIDAEDGDEDVISSIHRENRTQVRDVSVSPNRDDKKMYDFEFSISGQASTSVRMNRYEMEAWGNAMLAKAEDIRRGDV